MHGRKYYPVVMNKTAPRQGGTVSLSFLCYSLRYLQHMGKAP